jgi:hypothetical protein
VPGPESEAGDDFPGDQDIRVLGSEAGFFRAHEGVTAVRDLDEPCVLLGFRTGIEVDGVIAAAFAAAALALTAVIPMIAIVAVIPVVASAAIVVAVVPAAAATLISVLIAILAAAALELAHFGALAPTTEAVIGLMGDLGEVLELAGGIKRLLRLAFDVTVDVSFRLGTIVLVQIVVIVVIREIVIDFDHFHFRLVEFFVAIVVVIVGDHFGGIPILHSRSLG